MSDTKPEFSMVLSGVGPYAPDGGVSTHMKYLLVVSSSLPVEGDLNLFIFGGRTVDIGDVSENVGALEPLVVRNGSRVVPLTAEQGSEGWDWHVEFGFPFSRALNLTIALHPKKGGAALARLDRNPFVDNVRVHQSRAALEAEEFANPELRAIRLKRNRDFPRLSLAMSDLRQLPHSEAARKNERLKNENDFVEKASNEIMHRLKMGFGMLWRRWEVTNKSEEETRLPLGQLRMRIEEGGNHPPPGFASFDEAKIHYANERWARSITEILLLSSYGGSGECYFGRTTATEQVDAAEYDDLLEELEEELGDADTVSFRHSLDYELCKGLSSEATGADDAYYPMVAACQHLASMGVLSRGHKINPDSSQGRSTTTLADTTLNAGSHSAVTLTQKLVPKGAWMKKSGEPAEPVSAVTGHQSYAASTAALAETLGAGVPQTQSRYDSSPSSDWAKSAGKNADGEECELGPGAVAVFANHPTAELKKDPRFQPEDHVLEGFYTPTQISAFAKRWKKYQRKLTEHEQGQREMAPMLPREPAKSAFDTNQKLLADNTIGAHIGFLLRVGKGASPDVQTFDTGGLGTGESQVAAPVLGQSETHAAGLSHAGIMDYGGMQGFKGTAPFRGMGFLPKQEASDADSLLTHVEDVLEKARPLGFVRFLFLKKGVSAESTLMSPNHYARLQDWLVCASPLLRMHNATSGFSVARFVWALNELPWTDDFSIVTSIHFPRKQMAEAVLEGGRNISLDDAADRAFEIAEQGGSKYYPVNAGRTRLNSWAAPEEKLETLDDDAGGVKKRFTRESFMAANHAEDYRRQRVLYSLTRPMLELVTTPGTKPKQLYRYRTPRPTGNYPYYHLLERDQLPLNRSVSPLTEGNSDGQGSWDGTAAGKALFDAKCQQAELLLHNLDDLFAH